MSSALITLSMANSISSTVVSMVIIKKKKKNSFIYVIVRNDIRYIEQDIDNMLKLLALLVEYNNHHLNNSSVHMVSLE
jgi:hypothetical protein